MSRKVTSFNVPFSNTKLKSHKPETIKHSIGSGMGSVLLRTGGPGAGSSYLDIDDYVRTTGINPYARAGVTPKGSGLSDKLSSKLSALNIEKKSASELPKRKKIVMSM